MPTLGLQGSRYNIAVRQPDGEHVLAFNSATRSLLRVGAAAFEPMAPLFHDGRRGIPQDYRAEVPEGLDQPLVELLRDHGFLVPDGADEVAELRAAYERERHNEALYYTVGMTMACNFDCPYCFEEHLPIHMDRETADATHDFMMDQARQARATSLLVTWFGGEPLLVPDVLAHLSGRLRRSCAEAGIHYDSYVITNGALLDRACAQRLVEAGVSRAQVTLDGPREVHDRRRYFRGGQPSFDRILANLVDIKGTMPVMVRVNTDEDNEPHLGELVRVLEAAGLFAEPQPVQFYASAVVPYTEQARMLWRPLDVRRASGLEDRSREELAQAGVPEQQAVRGNNLLRANRGGCSAMQHHSFVIGPQGHLFKCELGIHDEREAVGSVHGPARIVRDTSKKPDNKRRLPILDARNKLAGTKALPWASYNPFDDDRCRSCQFSPVCKGGCPKRHLENDEPFLAATCQHWDTNFARLLEDAAREVEV